MNDRFEQDLRSRAQAARARGHVVGGWADVERRAAAAGESSRERRGQPFWRQHTTTVVLASLALIALVTVMVAGRRGVTTSRGPAFTTVQFTVSTDAGSGVRGYNIEGLADFARKRMLLIAIDWDPWQSQLSMRELHTGDGTWYQVPNGTAGGPDLRSQTGGKPWVRTSATLGPQLAATRMAFSDPVVEAQKVPGANVDSVTPETKHGVPVTHTRLVAEYPPSRRLVTDIWTDADGRLVESLTSDTIDGRPGPSSRVTVLGYDTPNFNTAWGPLDPPAESETYRADTVPEEWRLVGRLGL